MRTRRTVVLVALSVLGASLASATVTPEPAAADVPPGFVDEVVLSGFDLPTDIEFSADGRIFVAEKRGMVQVFDDFDDPTPTVFLDIRTQVFNASDMGMLGLALDPDFPATPDVYVAYVHDAPIGGTAPVYGEPNENFESCTPLPGDISCLSSGRLVRYEASGDIAINGEVLIEDWCVYSISHTLDDVEFGPDGMLYASAGDGALPSLVDYGQNDNECGDPHGARSVSRTGRAPAAKRRRSPRWSRAGRDGHC